METATSSIDAQRFHELDKQIMEAVRAELRNLQTIGRLTQRVEIRLPIENFALQNLSVMYLAPKHKKAL